MPRYSIKLSTQGQPLRCLFIPYEAPTPLFAEWKAKESIAYMRAMYPGEKPYDTWSVRILDRESGRYIPVVSGRVEP